MTKTPQVAALPGVTPLGLSEQPTSYAHLYRARKADAPYRYRLIISRSVRLDTDADRIANFLVPDKRTARVEAARYNASPWNF